MGDYDSPVADVDFAKYPNAQKLLDTCKRFFAEVENMYVIVLTIH